MSYKLIIKDEAQTDILEAVLWYEHIRTNLSIDFEFCLEEAFERILRNPLGYQLKYQNIRVCFTDRFPYGIHFFIEQETITIIALFHAYRNPAIWQGRIEK